jgi:hypothetical protein
MKTPLADKILISILSARENVKRFLYFPRLLRILSKDTAIPKAHTTGEALLSLF